MEIYLHGDRLFMMMETIPCFDHDTAIQELAGKPGQSEWEAFVAQFQQTSPDSSAGEKWQLMERIYKMGE